MVFIRAACPADAAALARLLSRCSDRTRYERFHGVVQELPKEYLRRCLHGDEQDAVVAEVGGELVGLASTGPVPGAPSVRELGVLVADAWQRRGVGRELAAALCTRARAAGVSRIRLELCRLRPDLLGHLVTRLPVAARSSDGCDVTVDVPADALARRPVDAPARAGEPPVPVATGPRDGVTAAGVSPPRPRSAPGTAPRPPSSVRPRRGARAPT